MSLPPVAAQSVSYSGANSHSSPHLLLLLLFHRLRDIFFSPSGCRRCFLPPPTGAPPALPSSSLRSPSLHTEAALN
ncbi:hypothetical protein L1887_22370 [Cichorium endivia]|nr:hypothetical protein L1887_22370 [Cichorium endivia]